MLERIDCCNSNKIEYQILYWFVLGYFVNNRNKKAWKNKKNRRPNKQKQAELTNKFKPIKTKRHVLCVCNYFWSRVRNPTKFIFLAKSLEIKVHLK